MPRRPSASLSLLVAMLAACSPATTPASVGPTPPAGPTEAAGQPSPTGFPPSTQPTPTDAGVTEGPSATPGPLPAGSWARLEPDGPTPAAREDHTWTVDERGGTAYLFGGRDGGTAFSDVWAYDLAADRWSRIDVAGPGPDARFGHEAAWIPGHGLAIFAGQAGPRFFNDVWLFDPATASWTELPGGRDAPVPRYGSCSGVGPHGRLWISHGFTEDGVRFSDTHAYDFEARTWTNQRPGSDVPVVRCLHACWWTDDGRFALYGGQTTGVPALGDLWLLEPEAPGSHRWTEVTGDLPRARQLAAVARLPGTTIVIGGRGTNGQPLDDQWQLVDGATTFVRLAATDRVPPGRSGASLIHDPEGDRLLLFGGIAANERDDLWELSWP